MFVDVRHDEDMDHANHAEKKAVVDSMGMVVDKSVAVVDTRKALRIVEDLA